MFIVSFFYFLYAFICVLAILLVLIQRGKGSLGVGYLGGANQLLFGSSGGQDIYQKITWTFLVIILFGSFALAILRNRFSNEKKINYKKTQVVPTNPDFVKTEKDLPAGEKADSQTN